MKLLIILALVFLETCTGQMLGGKVAKDGQFPFAVQIRMQNCKGTCHCGGAIVAPHWVITAAHCVQPNNTIQPVAIVAGDRWKVPKGEIPRVEIGAEKLRVYPHPEFDADNIKLRWYDVALIFVRDPFTSDPKVKMIGFGSDHGVRNGQECTVMGWGLSRINWRTQEVKRRSNVLRHGKLNITKIGQKFIHFGDMNRVTGPYLLWGDSGSPLVCEDAKDRKQRLFGWQKGVRVPSNDAVFVNYHHLKDWIRKTQADVEIENKDKFQKDRKLDEYSV